MPGWIGLPSAKPANGWPSPREEDETYDLEHLVLLGDSPRVSGCIGLGRFGSGGGDGGADCAMRRSYGVDAMATIQRTTSVASSPIAT